MAFMDFPYAKISNLRTCSKIHFPQGWFGLAFIWDISTILVTVPNQNLFAVGIFEKYCGPNLNFINFPYAKMSNLRTCSKIHFPQGWFGLDFIWDISTILLTVQNKNLLVIENVRVMCQFPLGYVYSLSNLMTQKKRSCWKWH